MRGRSEGTGRRCLYPIHFMEMATAIYLWFLCVSAELGLGTAVLSINRGPKMRTQACVCLSYHLYSKFFFRVRLGWDPGGVSENS